MQSDRGRMYVALGDKIVWLDNALQDVIMDDCLCLFVYPARVQVYVYFFCLCVYLHVRVHMYVGARVCTCI